MAEYDVENRVKMFLERELNPETNPRGFVTFMSKNVAVGAILHGHKPVSCSGKPPRHRFSIRISRWLSEHEGMTIFGMYKISIVQKSVRRGTTYKAELVDDGRNKKETETDDE